MWPQQSRCFLRHPSFRHLSPGARRVSSTFIRTSHFSFSTLVLESHFNHSLLFSSLSSHLSKLIDPENTFCKEVLQSLTELFPLPSIPDLAFTFPPLLLFSFLFPLKSLVFFIPSARDHILPSYKCLPSSPKNISPISCCVAE